MTKNLIYSQALSAAKDAKRNTMSLIPMHQFFSLPKNDNYWRIPFNDSKTIRERLLRPDKSGLAMTVDKKIALSIADRATICLLICYRMLTLSALLPVRFAAS
jgi:hypothetical protein